MRIYRVTFILANQNYYLKYFKLPGFDVGFEISGLVENLSVVEDGFVNVGINVGFVIGGFPDGFIILVGFVRSGNITAGISSIVVHVDKPNCEEVELKVVDEFHKTADEDNDEGHGLEGFSVTSFAVVFIFRCWSIVTVLELIVELT